MDHEPYNPSQEHRCLGCCGPLTVLGKLGSTTHYRCRNCGLEQSWEPSEVISALEWFGINATPEDCDYCEDGSVWYGLTQIVAPN